MTLFRFSAGLAVSALAISLPVIAGCGGSSNSGATPFSDTTVAAGNAQTELVYGVAGARGYMPIVVQSADGTTINQAIDANDTVSIGTASVQTVVVTAPVNYADRSFVAWQQGGQNISTGVAISFTPASVATKGAITAVYQPLPPAGGAFTPNFTRQGFPSWDHFPVKVYLDATVAAGSSNMTSIVNGMNRWVAASGGAVSYQLVTDSTQADIDIGFASTPSGLAGLTSASWDANLHMTNATVALNPPTVGPGEVALQNLDTIMAHEFGHSLGLVSDTDLTAGHSTNPSDTMYVTGNTQIGLITARDINTLATNYTGIFTGAATRGQFPIFGSTSHAGPAVHHAQIQ